MSELGQKLKKAKKTYGGKEYRGAVAEQPRPTERYTQTGSASAAFQQFEKQYPGGAQAPVNPSNPYDTVIENWRKSNDFTQGYAADTLGPQAEKLPYGAKGWDWAGRPYYGQGLGGWWNEVWSKLTAPVEKPAPPVQTQPLPEGATTAQKIGGVAKTAYTKAENLFEQSQNVGTQGEKPNIFGYIPRLASAGVGSVMDLYNAATIAAEKGVGTIQLMAALAAARKGEKPPELPEAAKYTYGTAVRTSYEPINKEYEDFWKGYFGQALKDVPVTELWDKKTWQAAADASRLYFSSFTKDLPLAEFGRRLNAGENPYLLQQQLENPGAELVGALLMPNPADALGFISKAIRSGRDIRKAESAVVANMDELEHLLKIGQEVAPDSEQVIKAVDALADVQMLKSERASLGLLDKAASANNPFAYTASGRQFFATRKGMGLLGTMALNGEPDEVMEAVRAMVLAASKNKDETLEAMRIVRRSPYAREILSEAGDEAGIIIRKTLEDAEGKVNGEKFLKSMKAAAEKAAEQNKTPAEGIIDWATGVMKKATDEVFPTIAQRNARIQAAVASGEDLSPWLAEMGKTSALANTMDKIHSFAQAHGVRQINRLLGGVYMAASPAYAARNAMNNFATLALDEGIGNAFRIFTPKANLEYLARNKIYSKAALEGFGGLEATLEGGKLLAGQKGLRRGFSGVSEKIEEAAATAVVRAAVEHAMRQMMVEGRAIPLLKDARAMGFSDEAAKQIIALVEKNGWDFKQGLADYRRLAKEGMGSVDTILAGSWKSDDLTKNLSEFGLNDQITRAVSDAREAGKSKEEVIAMVRQMQKEIQNTARTMAGRAAETVEGDPALASMMDEFGDAVTKGKISQGAKRLNVQALAANRNSFRETTMGIQELTAGAKAQAMKLHPDKPEIVQAINQLESVLKDARVGLFPIDGFGTTARSRELWDDLDKFGDFWYGNFRQNTMKAGSFADKGDDWWKAMQESLDYLKTGINLGEKPKTWTQFDKAFYRDFFFPAKQQAWRNYRDVIKNTFDSALELIRKTMPEEIENSDKLVNKIDDFYNTSKWYDDKLIGKEWLWKLEDAREAGDYTTFARTYAAQLGISSATEAGVPLDKKILNMINANLPEGVTKKYTDLSQVEPDIAAEALFMHSRKPVTEAGETALEAAAKAGEAPGAVAQVAPEAAKVPWDELSWEQQRDLSSEVMMRLANEREFGQTLKLANETGLPVVRDYAQLPPPEPGYVRVYHGTWDKNLKSISEKGLIPQKELQPGLENATDVVLYSRKPQTLETASENMFVGNAVLVVDLPEALVKEGNVVRTGKIPAEYIKGIYVPERTVKNFTFSPEKIGFEGKDWNETLSHLKDIAKKEYEGVAQAAPEAARVVVPDEIKQSIENMWGGEVSDEALDNLNKFVKDNASKEELRNIKDIESNITALEQESQKTNAWKNAYRKEIEDYQKELRKVVDRVEKVPEAAPEVETAAGRIAKGLAEDVPTPYSGGVPDGFQAVDQMSDKVSSMFDNVVNELDAKWGEKATVDMNRKINEALDNWALRGRRNMNQVRTMAAQIGDAHRDFTLLNYQKTGVDLAAAYIFPYQYWYNRTYMNWMKRLAYDAGFISRYARYRDTLEKIHAGAPDWWKYNVNSNELLGFKSDHPLFFNLEQTLNPIQGLTGVDFNDPEKRVSWWTNLIDDIGKYGPSVWTPISMATALNLHIKGMNQHDENLQEAAARWGGRFIPQTAMLKSVANALGVHIPGTLANELDPMVSLLSGGIDPYERRRVGRTLMDMAANGEITYEQALDASMTQEGPVWEKGIERQSAGRAGGNIASFMFGVGYKPRGVGDMQIDLADRERRYIIGLSPQMTAEEVRTAWDQYRDRWPFMDAVILARKASSERNRVYAYNVLGRIPPGLKSSMAEASGIAPEQIDKFYADKGNLDTWTQPDVDQFMAGVARLGSVLSMPQDATADEWTQASAAYRNMDAQMQQQFGPDILDKVLLYNATYGDGSDYLTTQAAQAYLDANPDVNAAKTWKNTQIMNNPFLAAYYGSYFTVKSALYGKMYADLEKKYPKALDTINEYYAIKDAGGDYYAFSKKYKNIMQAYWDAKDKITGQIAGEVVSISKSLPKPELGKMRPDAATSGLLYQNIQQAMQGREQQPRAFRYTPDDWQNVMGGSLYRLARDYIVTDKKLTYSAENALNRVADNENIPVEVMLQLIAANMR